MQLLKFGEIKLLSRDLDLMFAVGLHANATLLAEETSEMFGLRCRFGNSLPGTLAMEYDDQPNR